MQAFFADIYTEAKRAKPGAGHQAIAALAAAGKLQRHYTLNIDGLATAAGMSVWHHQVSPEGTSSTVHPTWLSSGPPQSLSQPLSTTLPTALPDYLLQ